METNTVLRTGATDLTADETLTSLKVGPMTKPLWLHVIVPEVSAGGTIDVSLEFCAAAAKTSVISKLLMEQIDGAGFFSVPFYTKHEYLQVKLDITGEDFDAGAVKVWIDPAHRGAGKHNV